jgi:release factor glutamine methyltransferase
MKRKIPAITKNLIKDIKENANKGIYRLKIGKILIDVFPYVYPPLSPFSDTSKIIHTELEGLSGKEVLDMGTGTGIQAIISVINGAKHVDAVDISDKAIICANHNVKINNVENKIKIFQSDMFSNIPKKKYDVIIANLPIFDHPTKNKEFLSLFDPEFIFHKELFEKAAVYIKKNGKIIMSHANLNSNKDFGILEKMAAKNGFSFRITKKNKLFDNEWRNYEFFIK